MLKHLLLGLILFLFTSITALAQAPLPAAPPAPATSLPALLPPGQMKEKYRDYLYQRYASDRKALAVIRLFNKRQVGGAIWLAGGAAMLGTLVGISGTHDSGSTRTTVTVDPLAYIIYPGPFLGVGIGKLTRFSNARLYEALAGYDRTGTLPNYVQGRLRERDYQ